MFSSFLGSFVFIAIFIATIISAQSSTASGYVGYNMTVEGDDPTAATYDTTSTPANVSTTVPEPDVYLNASVFVGEIDITVANLSAQINLQAQVLSLLQFNAGVDVSIDRVELLIQNVSAQVTLEARLANLVLMIGDVLDSLDLNPILVTLGQDVGDILNTTVGGLTGDSTVEKRGLSYNLAHNILYSINDYSGHTHTNRILSQTGTVIDQSLDDDGNIYNQKEIGNFLSQMTYNGYNQTMVLNGQVVHELEYIYQPFTGLSVVSAIYIDDTGSVVSTQVLSESGGGGGSTMGD